MELKNTLYLKYNELIDACIHACAVQTPKAKRLANKKPNSFLNHRTMSATLFPNHLELGVTSLHMHSCDQNDKKGRKLVLAQLTCVKHR